MDKKGDGWTVKEVIPGSPAEAGGLKAGDVLVELEGVAYRKANWKRLEKAYDEMSPGKTITYTVRRRGETRRVSVELATIPKRIRAQWLGQHLLESYAMLEKSKQASEKKDGAPP